MLLNFTVLSDIHIGSYQGLMESGGLNSRFIDFVKTYNEAVDYTIKNECDFCLITGDIFKHKDPQPIEFDAFSNGIKRLMNFQIPIIIVLGNHDIFLSHKLKNSISALKTLDLKNLYISSEPELIYFYAKDGTKLCVQTMPYQIKNLLGKETNEDVAEYMANKINELYSKIEKEVPCIFAGHFSIKDSTTGTEQSTINKFNEPIIDKDIFKGKKYIYIAMGHLHTFQEIMKSPPIVYGGSLNRIDFNEWKEDKGFIHGKFDKNFSYKFIKVNAKKFLDLKYNLENDDNPEQKILDDLKKRENELKNTIVRISVNISEKNKNNYSVKNITDYLNSHCDYIQGSAIPHIIKSDTISGSQFSEYILATDALKKYCEMNERIIDKQLFLKLGEEIIKETNLKK